MGLIGIALILGVSYALSESRKSIRVQTVIVGLVLQVVLALAVLRGDLLAMPFDWIPIAFSAFLLIIAVYAGVLFAIMRIPQLTALAKAIPAKAAFGLLYVLAGVFLFKFNLVGRFFESLKDGVGQLLIYAREGSTFVFGALGSSQKLGEVFGGALGAKVVDFTVVFAFQILPTIVFVAALFSVLYYIGVMQPIVRGLAVAMKKTMAASGAESLDVAANIFMGQTEAPLTIFPYLPRLTRSELFTIMVSGMAHTAAGILLAYAAVSGVDAKHLLTAIIMTAPGSILLAKMWVPEREIPETMGGAAPVASAQSEDKPVNVVDAAARGARSGLDLALNVAAMLIAFISLIALANGILSAVRGFILTTISGADTPEALALWCGPLEDIRFACRFPSSLQEILGWVFAPAAWTLGVPWKDAVAAGNLLGTKFILNEFVAFVQLGPIRTSLQPATVVILTYALCGFANISSIAIQVGGIGGLIPGRRNEMAKMGFRAVVAGTLASLMAGAIAGLLIQI